MKTSQILFLQQRDVTQTYKFQQAQKPHDDKIHKINPYFVFLKVIASFFT